MRVAARTYRIFLTEVRQLAGAPLPLVIAVVCPVAAWLVIAATLARPLISDIPVAVVDEDRSALSRRLVRLLDATQALEVASRPATMDEAAATLRRGSAALVVQLPAGLEGDLKRGGGATVSVVANGAELLLAKVAYRSVATSIHTISAGVRIRRLEAAGLPPERARALAVPVHTEIHAPGNPWYDYALYLVPGMMMAILQMSACFSTLWLFRRHREGSAALIVPPPGTRIAFVIGRGLPLLLANTLAVLALFLGVFPIVGVPPSPAWPGLLARTMLFTVVSMGMGAFFSALFGNQVTGAQISLLINAPAFVFSGYTFPRWAMPAAVRGLAECIPLTQLLDGFFPLLVFGTPTLDGLAGLAIFGVLFWGGAFLLVSPPGERLRAFERRVAARLARSVARSVDRMATP